MIKNDIDEFMSIIPRISMLEEYGRKHPNTYELFEEGNIKFLFSMVDTFNEKYPESNLRTMLDVLWEALLYAKMPKKVKALF